MVQIGDMTIQTQATVMPVSKWIYISKASDATASIPYTGVGFKPSHVVFWMVSANQPIASFGHDDGVNPVCHQTPENENPADAGTWQRNGVGGGTSIIMIQDTTGEFIGKITSMDPDGFTISWTRTGATTLGLQITAMCYK